MKLNRNHLIFFGLTTHLLTAFFSTGYHQCDELFQVYEFAGYKLGLNTAADLPWEFHEKMRSGIQPLIVFGVTKAANAAAIHNPFSIAMIIRIFQSLFSFVVMVCFLRILEREIVSESCKLLLWAFGLLFWCLPYFHVRFSSENFSATVFITGLILLNINGQETTYLRLLIAGMLFGLAFVCRFQMSFMIAGFILWMLFFRKISAIRLLVVFLGIFVSLGIGLMADYWLYGEYTLSWWNYLDLNLFRDKASIYGKEPFYFYFEQAFLQLVPPFSIFFVFCILTFWVKFKTHVITWITLPYILLHFFVAHKELRFLFAILDFLPFMVLYVVQSFNNSRHQFFLFLRTKKVLRFAVIVNLILLIYYTFKPADETSQSLKKIYELVDGNSPVLLYEDRNPYNNMASLNYFRNPRIKTQNVNVDSSFNMSDGVYFFSEKSNPPERIVKGNRNFVKLYSSFPQWISYFNFNGWLERAGIYSIYKISADRS